MSIKPKHPIRTALILIIALCIAGLPANSGQVYASDSGSTSGGFDWSRTAILALSTDANAVEFDGQSQFILSGGDIYSNGGMVKSGASGQISLTDGNILLALDNGWSCTGCNNSVLPLPRFSDYAGNDLTPVALPAIPEPYCPAADEVDPVHGVNYYVHAGISGTTVLLPGIHCVDGDISLGGSDALSGMGVMVVLKNGGIKTSGNASINLKAGPTLVDKNGIVWGGMLIYMSPASASTFQLGGGETVISGTIFAPQSTCEIGGSGETFGQRGQMICSRVKVHGSASIAFWH
jgi:hypothetical protein